MLAQLTQARSETVGRLRKLRNCPTKKKGACAVCASERGNKFSVAQAAQGSDGMKGCLRKLRKPSTNSRIGYFKKNGLPECRKVRFFIGTFFVFSQ